MRRLFHVAMISGFALGGAMPAFAIPAPPMPPEQAAEHLADCRTPPTEAIALTVQAAPLPNAPATLRLETALRVETPAGARLGSVVGVTATDDNTILAVTSGGYWIRVTPSNNATANHPMEAVAVSIRDPKGTPSSMARLHQSPTVSLPYAPAFVALSYADRPWLYQYEVSGCFPGGRPTVYYAPSTEHQVLRLLPGAGMLTHARIGDTFVRPFTHTQGVPIHPASQQEMAATVYSRFALAQGCDELAFYPEGGRTQVRTGCSTGYLAWLTNLEAKPQRQHRQPQPRRGTRAIGTIDAAIVAVSEQLYLHPSVPSTDPVPRGDRNNPGQRCGIILAAQSAEDAPITFYRGQPYCAYYPRDPSGAPYPPPPPP